MPQAAPYLRAQGIPSPCPQLVGLGFCHVCPLLCIIQFMLGLAILGQISVCLLFLGAQAGWVTLWQPRWSVWSHPIIERVLLLFVFHYAPTTTTHVPLHLPPLPLTSTHSKKEGVVIPLQRNPCARPGPERESTWGPLRDKARSHLLLLEL